MILAIGMPALDFWQFRKVGQEQWLAQSHPLVSAFIRLFGPLGVHARIRNARVINAIQQLLLPASARILDAGCGHGYATFWLAQRYPRCSFKALDADRQIIQANQLIATRLGLDNVDFVQSDALSLAETKTYDLIFSIDLLEHVVDDVGLLAGFHRALRPGGWLLLHLPRRHQEHWRLFSAFTAHTTPDHVRDEYTASEIYDRVAQAGFQVEYLRYGFSWRGEIAFELNYLFWRWNRLRILAALATHPLAVWLAYLDTRQNYADGNSLLVLTRAISG